MSKLFEPAAWIALIIAGIILFANLGGFPLFDPDEPVYAETGREMLQFHDFVSPRIYGQYWYDKPPMYYWLVAASFQAIGDGEFAARLPSAICALGCVAAVFRFGAEAFGLRGGLFSALILATSAEFIYLGKAAVTDMTLTFFLTMSMLSFCRREYLKFFFFAGLATVTKGPIGILFPIAAALPALFLPGDFVVIRRSRILLGGLIYAIVAVPWYFWMWRLHGAAFIDTFIGFHNITRFTTPEHPEGAVWWYFIPVLILGFFPWTAILVQAVWKSLFAPFSRSSVFEVSLGYSGPRLQAVLIFLNLWAAIVFIFFSISQTKLVSYIMPLYPPLALICGWYIDQICDLRRGGRLIAWPLIFTFLAAGVFAGTVAGLKVVPELETATLGFAGILIVMVLLTWLWVWRRMIVRAFATIVIGITVIFVLVSYVAAPIAAPYMTASFITADFCRLYDGSSPVYVTKFLRPGFAYYSGLPGEEIKIGGLAQAVSIPGKAYYVVRQEDYNHLPESGRQLLTVLSAQKGRLLLLKER